MRTGRPSSPHAGPERAEAAEAALRASEARFLAAAESIPDGLVILDAEDRIVFYNSRHPELLPPALREVLRPGSASRTGSGKAWPAARSTTPTWARTTRTGGRGAGARSTDRARAQARRRPLGAHPRGAHAGRRPGAAHHRHHRPARERRRASEARFLAAAESIPDGLAIFDAEDRFAFHNSRYPEHLTANLRQVLRLGVRSRTGSGGPRTRPDLPSRHGRGLRATGSRLARRGPLRARAQDHRRALGALREPDGRRRAGAAHHRRHRAAPARAAS